MVYIALKQNKIIHICETDKESSVIKSMAYLGVTEYDEIYEVGENTTFTVGNDIREYNDSGTLRPGIDRMIDEYLEIPEGMKLNENQTELIEKTLKEKIDSGEIILSEYQKYDKATDSIIEKTQTELYNEGIITLDTIQDSKMEEISLAFDDELSTGSFFSNTFGFDIDLRRINTKNDLQNVDSLISDFENLEDYEKYYVGCTETADFMFTLEQLQSLKTEMIQSGRQSWIKKRLKYIQIGNCTTAEELEEINW